MKNERIKLIIILVMVIGVMILLFTGCREERVSPCNCTYIYYEYDGNTWNETRSGNSLEGCQSDSVNISETEYKIIKCTKGLQG